MLEIVGGEDKIVSRVGDRRQIGSLGNDVASRRPASAEVKALLMTRPDCLVGKIAVIQGSHPVIDGKRCGESVVVTRDRVPWLKHIGGTANLDTTLPFYQRQRQLEAAETTLNKQARFQRRLRRERRQSAIFS